MITGAETDVCVPVAVLGAVGFGYRVVLATDALCGSSDETHAALLTLYQHRFGQQIETAGTETILACLKLSSRTCLEVSDCCQARDPN